MEDTQTAQSDSTPCFRCGVCCRKYTPRASVTEVERIADYLEISLEIFRERYIDDSWYEPDYFLIDNQDGACIFLCETDDERIVSCRIHHLRPTACREWQAGLDKKECLKGLEKYWGLTVDSLCRLSGPTERLREFRSVFKIGD